MKLEDLIGKITCADCLDILKQLPDKCVDLVLTDPPYGIKADKGSSSFGVQDGRKYSGDWDSKIPEKIIFDEMLRVAKNAIIFGGNYFTEYLKPTKSWIVWDKVGENKFKNPFSDVELAWTSLSFATRKITCIQQGFINEDKSQPRIHPTQKPLKLFETILQDCSKENDLILDCFSGSGTTAVACHNLKRRFICIEKDPEYAKASQERLEQAQRQQTLF